MNESLLSLSLCNQLIDIAALAAYELIPHDIAILFALGSSYKEQIDLVKKMGEFIR